MTAWKVSIFLLMSIITWGCSCNSKAIPAKGRLDPYKIKTTVDSPKAKYFLENYLSNKKDNQEYNKEIESINLQYGKKNLSADDLKRIADSTSTDFAALYWGNRLINEPQNKELQNKFLYNLEKAKSSNLQLPKKDYLVILIPGLDYEENGDYTGADLRGPIEILRKNGVDVLFLAVPPMGTVEDNAKLVAQSLKQNSNREIIIAGPSSAGPAIYSALGRLLAPSEVKHIKAWVNLGGIIHGSPVIDWVASGVTYPIWKLVLLNKGWDSATFESLSVEKSKARNKEIKLPKNILVLNYIGLSLSGNISDFAMDKYCIMKRQGPNDGLALLPEMIVPGSLTILATSVDHFFAEDPFMNLKALAIYKTALDLLLGSSNSL